MECANATQFQKGDTVCAYFMGELHLGTYDKPEAGGRHLIKDIVNFESGYPWGTGNGSLPTGQFGKWQKKKKEGKGGGYRQRVSRKHTRRSRKQRGTRKH
jgi:hypothetical protein